MPWHPPCALISLITKTNVQVFAFLTLARFTEARISSSRFVITGNAPSVFILISRFLFAFYDMRFSRYVFALYRFAIQCSGRLIEQAQTLDLQVAFAPLRHGFIRAVLEVSSEPSKRYMRESFTRPASRPKRYFNCDAFRIDFRSAKSSFRFPSPIDLGC